MAYQLWEQAGCPDGQDLQFWLDAERHLLQKPEAVKLATVAAKPAPEKKVLTSPPQHRAKNGAVR